jgi:hypothetical protein
MAIELKDFFAFTHYEYGEAYFGSYKGMRYRLARNPLENVHFTPVDKRDPDATLMATVWPEPYSYAHTADELKTTAHFPITEEGMASAVDWFNEQYNSRLQEWTKNI